MPPLAVITMVFNENLRLPYWLAHYARQVGIEHCYVVDHGSDDGSTDMLFGANRILIPRSPQDNDKRLKLISSLADGLLNYYRRVAYVDADELLVADPARYADLSSFAAQMQAPAVTSIGLELVQGPSESGLKSGLGLGAQRSSALFSSSMCKSNLIGVPVTWAPGWHSHNGPPHFDSLYLFHLRHVDRDHGLARLAITREMPWADPHAGKHQRVDDEWMENVMRFFGNRPLSESGSLGGANETLAADLRDFLADSAPNPDPRQPYAVPLARYGTERIALGEAFRTAISERPFELDCSRTA